MDLPDTDWHALLSLAAEAREARNIRYAGAPGALSQPPVSADIATLVDPLSSAIYVPLIEQMAQGSLVIAQVGQSLDGRIATLGGHSHYVNGEAALTHLHRLRALVDGVLIGASTAVLDDPRLTTRRVEGPNPVRIVLDPRRRVPPSARMFDGAAPSLAVRSSNCGSAACSEQELLLPVDNGAFAPVAVLDALAERGLRALLIEGGGETISNFLRAGLVHRIHVLLAPMLIGPGREAFRLPAIDTLDAARRFRMTAHPLGDDILLDCDLSVRN